MGIPQNAEELAAKVMVLEESLTEVFVDPEIVPYRNLLSAVLERAMVDLFGCTRAVEDPLCTKEVVRWIFVDAEPEPFNFSWVCYYLEYNESSIRRHLLKQIEKDYELANNNNPAMAQKLHGLRCLIEECTVRDLHRRSQETSSSREEAASRVREDRRKSRRDRKFCL